MRVAFFADIHGNLPALEAAIDDARARGVSHVICLGDIVGYGPQPAETLERLRAVASAAVLGNHDAAAAGLLDAALFNPFARDTAVRAEMALDAEAKAWLRSLPYVLEGDGFACVHGTFDAPERFLYLENKEDAALSLAAAPDFPLLVVGHTHIACAYVRSSARAPLRRLPLQDFLLPKGARCVLNPGSIGFPRADALDAQYAIYDTTLRRVTFHAVPYDLAPYRLAVVRNGYNTYSYWFLSPAARQRQTEQAFLAPPARPASLPAVGAPFRPQRRRRTFSKTFWFFSTLLALCLGAMLALILRPAAPGAAETAHHAPGDGFNLLPPLDAWGDLCDGEPCLVSPLVTLPPGAARLRFAFTLVAPGSLNCTVRPLFVNASGKAKASPAHPYKRDGAKSFKIDVPPNAAALRLRFDGLPPGALRDPVLTLESDK